MIGSFQGLAPAPRRSGFCLASFPGLKVATAPHCKQVRLTATATATVLPGSLARYFSSRTHYYCTFPPTPFIGSAQSHPVPSTCHHPSSSSIPPQPPPPPPPSPFSPPSAITHTHARTHAYTRSIASSNHPPFDQRAHAFFEVFCKARTRIFIIASLRDHRLVCFASAALRPLSFPFEPRASLTSLPPPSHNALRVRIPFHHHTKVIQHPVPLLVPSLCPVPPFQPCILCLSCHLASSPFFFARPYGLERAAHAAATAPVSRIPILSRFGSLAHACLWEFAPQPAHPPAPEPPLHDSEPWPGRPSLITRRGQSGRLPTSRPGL